MSTLRDPQAAEKALAAVLDQEQPSTRRRARRAGRPGAGQPGNETLKRDAYALFLHVQAGGTAEDFHARRDYYRKHGATDGILAAMEGQLPPGHVTPYGW